VKRYVDAGLTTVGDRAVNADRLRVYQKLRTTGRLPIRAVLTWRRMLRKPRPHWHRKSSPPPFTTNPRFLAEIEVSKLTLDGGIDHWHGNFSAIHTVRSEASSTGKRSGRPGQLLIPPVTLAVCVRRAPGGGS